MIKKLKSLLFIFGIMQSIGLTAVYAQNTVPVFTSENRSPLFVFYKPKAAYPSQDRGPVCFTGSVRLKVEFLSTSEIGEVSVIKGLPFGANENAIEAARKIVFCPEMIDGEPITVKKTVVYNFSIY